MATRDCNLSCRYCYLPAADNRGADPKASAQWVDRVLTDFPSIRFVKLFGGEPLLAVDVVREVCARIEKWRANGRRLGISIVTNGTLLDRKAVQILSDHRISITVSLDGSAEIHDYLRPAARSRVPQWTRIVDGIALARTAGVAVNVEATYTREHKARGISVLDVLSDLGRLGFEVADLNPVMPTGESSVHFRREDWDELIEDIFRAAYLSVLWRYDRSQRPPGAPALLAAAIRRLDSLRQRAFTLHFCAWYPVSLTLDCDGLLYPCYAVEPSPQNSLGDASLATRIIDQIRAREAVATSLVCTKQKGACSSCWNQPFCRQCVWRLNLEGGSPAHPPDHLCRLSQAITEAVVLGCVDSSSGQAGTKQAVQEGRDD